MTAPAAAGSASTSHPPTSRIPILLLKTRSTPTDGYDDHFARRPPLTPIFVPVLQHAHNHSALASIRTLLSNGSFAPPSSSPTSVPKYGGLIFTSQRAVEAFASVLASLSPSAPPLAPLAVPFYTVGPATSRALTALRDAYLPRCSVEGAETGNGEALARYILRQYARPDRGSDGRSEKKRLPLLFLVGEQRRDVIPRTLQAAEVAAEDRVRVEEVVVYETGVMASFADDFRAGLARTREAPWRWVVVFSPTGCEGMLRELEWLDERTGRARILEEGEGRDGEDGKSRRGRRRTYVACIGPTTREYLATEFGFEVDVCADVPSPEGVGRGIERFMRENEML